MNTLSSATVPGTIELATWRRSPMEKPVPQLEGVMLDHQKGDESCTGRDRYPEQQANQKDYR